MLGITKSGAQGELFPEISRREQDGRQIWHTPTELFKVSLISRKSGEENGEREGGRETS